MKYVKYIGKPCNLGVHGAVVTGQVLAVSDMEAEYVLGNKDFKPTKLQDEDPRAALLASQRDIAQQDRQSLIVLCAQMLDDGYPTKLVRGQSVHQLQAMIGKALQSAPEAFNGDYRALYDNLAKETDEDLLAKGKEAGVSPDPKVHSRREIIAAIVMAKQACDADKSRGKDKWPFAWWFGAKKDKPAAPADVVETTDRTPM
jgi:hypothetical protein